MAWTVVAAVVAGRTEAVVAVGNSADAGCSAAAAGSSAVAGNPAAAAGDRAAAEVAPEIEHRYIVAESIGVSGEVAESAAKLDLAAGGMDSVTVTSDAPIVELGRRSLGLRLAG